MGIKIKTRLADGIYRSSGGGMTKTCYSYKTGPINLRKAVALLDEHRRVMEQDYGNIGCGSSWVEVEGIRLTWADRLVISDGTLDDARVFITSLRDGSLLESRRLEAEQAKEQLQRDEEENAQEYAREEEEYRLQAEQEEQENEEY